MTVGDSVDLTQVVPPRRKLADQKLKRMYVRIPKVCQDAIKKEADRRTEARDVLVHEAELVREAIWEWCLRRNLVPVRSEAQ